MVRLASIQTAQPQTIVAYRTQAARVTELAKIALPESQDRAYTSVSERREGHSVGKAMEARVNINPLSSIRSTPATTSTGQVNPQRSESSAKTTSPNDEVTFSPEAQETLSVESKSNADVEIRAERLAQIRAEIEAGTYDTDARFEAAIERMFDKLV